MVDFTRVTLIKIKLKKKTFFSFSIFPTTIYGNAGRYCCCYNRATLLKKLLLMLRLLLLPFEGLFSFSSSFVVESLCQGKWSASSKLLNWNEESDKQGRMMLWNFGWNRWWGWLIKSDVKFNAVNDPIGFFGLQVTFGFPYLWKWGFTHMWRNFNECKQTFEADIFNQNCKLFAQNYKGFPHHLAPTIVINFKIQCCAKNLCWNSVSQLGFNILNIFSWTLLSQDHHFLLFVSP